MSSTTAETVPAVTDDRFAAEVLEPAEPVVVDFWAAWCGPCRVLSPVIAEVAAARPDVRFRKLDIDANQQAAARYGVLAAPTIMVFRGGEPVLTLVGFRPRARLERELAAVI